MNDGVTRRTMLVALGGVTQFVQESHKHGTNRPSPQGYFAASRMEVRVAPTSYGVVGWKEGNTTSWFIWTYGNYMGQQESFDIVESDYAPLSTGAWIRVGAESVRYRALAGSAVSRSIEAKLNETASIADFGAIEGIDPSNAAVNDAALANARTYLATNKRGRLRFPPGIWLYETSPNWAIAGAEIIAEGDVTLRCTGSAGHAVLIDGWAPDAIGRGSEGVYGVAFRGFKVESEQYSAEPVYIRAMHQCDFNIHVRGGNPSLYGIKALFCVSTKFDQIKVSALDTGSWWHNGRPYGGIYLGSANAGKDVAYCTFINPLLEGINIGMYIDHGLGNTVFGGAMQGCSNAGMHMTANAYLNKIYGTDYEMNGAHDISCMGHENHFDNVDTANLLLINQGHNNRITGGAHAHVEIEAGSIGNSVEGVRYARPNPDGTPSGGAISDHGTRTLRHANLNLVTQKFDDDLLTELVLAVDSSPFSYINPSANPVSLLVTGGLVTDIEYAPQNVIRRPTGLTRGMFRLRPNDALTVTFTAAPKVYLYPE